MPRRCVIAMLVLLAFSGCDTKSSSPPPDLVKTQRDAMEKAKGVEKTLEQSMDRTREAEQQK